MQKEIIYQSLVSLRNKLSLIHHSNVDEREYIQNEISQLEESLVELEDMERDCLESMTS